MKKDSQFVVLLIVALVALISIIFNFVQMSTVNNAEDFSSKVSSYLAEAQKDCPSDPGNFEGMSACIDDLVEKLHEEPVLVEAMFVNYYLSTVQSKGVLIFKNIGDASFESNKFRLFINKEMQDDDGCEKKGTVEPGALCSLNFYKVCEPGDIIYVDYDGDTILAKSC